MTSSKPSDLGILRVLALMRIALCYVLVISLLGAQSPAKLPASAWQPVSLGYLLEGPPSPIFAELLLAVAFASTVMLALGLFTRWAGPVCLATSIAYVSFSMCFGKIGHSGNSALLVLFVMMFSDWGAVWSLDQLRRRKRVAHDAMPSPWPEWPIWMSTFAVALPYLSAGLLKIVKGNFLADTTLARTLAGRIVQRQAEGKQIDALVTWSFDRLFEHPWLIQWMAFGAVALESLFWVGLLTRRLRIIMLSLMIVLHSSISILMYINFGRHMMVCVILLGATGLLLLRDRFAAFARALPARPLEAGGPTITNQMGLPIKIGALFAGTCVLVVACGWWLANSELDPSVRAPIKSAISPFMHKIQRAQTPVLLVFGLVTALCTAIWYCLEPRLPPNNCTLKVESSSLPSVRLLLRLRRASAEPPTSPSGN